MKIQIDPKKELFRWGPIDGKLIYPDFFNVAFARYPKHFHSWPDVLWIGRGEKITCIIDNHKLYQAGQKNFLKYIFPKKTFEKCWNTWDKKLAILLKVQKKISAENLKKLTDRQLDRTYRQWVGAYLGFWTIGELPEIANWGGEIILKKNLQQVLSEKDFVSAFERLSAPEKLSFYQLAELELIGLKKYLSNKKLFERKLAAFQKKYFWIMNNYSETKVLTKEYFKNELKKYSKSKIDKIEKEFRNMPKMIGQEKLDIINKFRLDKKILQISDKLTFCIWWQDLRKYYIYLANHYITLFLNEFSNRYRLSLADLEYYNVNETLALTACHKVVSNREILRRKKFMAVYYSAKLNSLKYFSGSSAKKIISRFEASKRMRKTKSFKGIVVSRGKTICGRVRIITSASRLPGMKKGEILIATMTTPDYISAMKKAAAIVTDEGGMTCHAAIVARELKIPCIVGTKIATKVFKDGDFIEVDAEKGFVKRINNE